MGRGVFRIGVAPVGHGGESPHTLAPHRIKEIPLSHGHAYARGVAYAYSIVTA
jgi:hypothetical protein